MSDAGIAFIAGGFALGGSAIGSTLTVLGTNWLQARQRDHDKAMQFERFKEDRLARASEERLRLKREHLAPLFAVLGDVELVLAQRIAQRGWGKITYDTLPDELKTKLPREEIEKVFEEQRQEGTKELGAPLTVPTMLKAGLASLRVADDPALGQTVMTLLGLVTADELDLPTLGTTLAATQRMLLDYAAKYEG